MLLANGHDVFALPHEEGFIVYAPLAGRIVYANSDCVAQLQGYLETHGLRSVDSEIIAQLGGLEWLDNKVPPTPLPVDRQFHPTSVTLFLTNRCNLRCTYCYADAGDLEAVDMQPEMYRAAIDFIVRNAQRAGRPPRIGFHGGGEPTVAWDTLVGAVEYSRERVGDEAEKIDFGIATNGVMSRDKAEFVAKTFPTVTLSFDGPADVQNSQRPCRGNSGSFDDVMSFVEVLRSHETMLVVRSTITNLNIDRLSEMVGFFVDNTGCQLIHFEPVFERGRCRSLPDAVPSPDAFAEAFIAALDHARKRGVRLRYSATRLMGVFSSFCGCAQDAFNVTPDGDVTACFEVCDAGNPLAETFYFGRFDQKRTRFSFDKERLARLRSLTIHNKPLCERCFAKWNCSGDCPVKTKEPVVDFQNESSRCRMNQTITKALLIRALDKETCAFV